jgi:hypothetical protein
VSFGTSCHWSKIKASLRTKTGKAARKQGKGSRAP